MASPFVEPVVSTSAKDHPAQHSNVLICQCRHCFSQPTNRPTIRVEEEKEGESRLRQYGQAMGTGPPSQPSSYPHKHTTQTYSSHSGLCWEISNHQRKHKSPKPVFCSLNQDSFKWTDKILKLTFPSHARLWANKDWGQKDSKIINYHRQYYGELTHF